jgi:PII-like signaling protein
MESAERSVLKIYTSSTDKFGKKLLYEYVVYKAKEKGITGVTVYRGIMGYGLSSRHISSSRYWELTEKLPVVIEMIDDKSVLEEFFRFIEPGLLNSRKGILVTLESVNVLLQKQGIR